jgi:hypothetical protein
MSDFGKTKFKAEHRRIREMLSLYIDGELSSGDRARVEEHLAECDDCTWELETLRQTVELVGQLPKVPVPRAFTIYETPRPRPFGLFQARWVYTYLKGATALAAALLILVLAADALFQFQRMTASFAPAKEFAAPAAAPTVVARQEAPPAPTEAPGLAEEVLGEAEVTPSPSAIEETKALVPMPMPTPMAPAARDDGLAARAGAAATPLATPVPRVDKAEATGTPLPAAAMEAPAAEEGALEAPPPPAAAPTATPQPQMTATPIHAAPLVSASAVPSATPTPMAVATATATATSVPTATPVSMARAPAEVRATEEKGALAGPPARPRSPRLTLLRVVEASLCLLVMVLIAATLMVRRRSEP